MYVGYLVCFAYIYTDICIDVYSFIVAHMRCYLFACVLHGVTELW